MMNNTLEIKKCEVCDSINLTSVLNLGTHPMCDDLIPIGSTSKCEEYPVEILYCSVCDTAHQKYQVPKYKLFPQSYHYRSRFTADVLTGMQALVDSADTFVGSLAGRVVVDVGCNDGSLLDKFAAKGARTIGIEPTGAYQDAEGRGHLIMNDFFNESTAKKIIESQHSIDIITFTNVFAHIEDLHGLLRSLKILMHENTVLIVENHYLGAVLDTNQFDTFYHEHPRTYSLHSFMHIARTLGREVIRVEFPQRYGGNIRVMIGKSGHQNKESSSQIETYLHKEAGFMNKFKEMDTFINLWKKDKKAEIDTLRSLHGKLRAKAFPGRAAIIVKLLGLSEAEIECVYERPGSLKVGNYLPGTRIPIRSDDELFDHIDNINVLVNFAWHIPVEIEEYLRKNSFIGKIVHVV